MGEVLTADMTFAPGHDVRGQFALDAARLLGDDGVRSGPAAAASAACTTGLRREIACVVYPRHRDDVAALVRLAVRTQLPVYPVSTGRNWGYGSANPVMDGCVVMNLSRMDRVLAFDAECGLVTLEPGVTQGRLAQFLRERQAPYMVPTTGAGPSASIVGNALERGYGITPFADHFAALTGLEAVLADGSVYESPLARMGAAEAGAAHKWQIGPYVDGLFGQGAFGVVTRATIALARRPECVQGFLLRLPDDAMLEGAVESVREMLATLPGTLGGVNLMNGRRVLAMSAPYPRDKAGAGGVVPDGVWRDLCRRYRIAAWTGFGTLYGTARMVAAARSEVRRLARRAGASAVFLSPGVMRGLRAAAATLRPVNDKAARTLRTLQSALDLTGGVPNETALPLAYWKHRDPPAPGADLDPAGDGCGLIWYAPLVDAHAERVRKYVDLAVRVTAAYGMEPLLTLSSLSERCFGSTLPLLFDARSPEEARRAAQCHEALLAHGKDCGFVPYRVGVQDMDWLVQQAPEHWRLVARLKQALDPGGIIAPGRYAAHSPH